MAEMTSHFSFFRKAYPLVKRLFDIVFSFAGILVMLFPWLIIAVAIKLDSPGPVFFRQHRMGRDLKPFVCWKFRTMTTDAPPECKAELLSHHEVYVTRVGRFLRQTSLDETSQFINIFLGDMSFIGPRPVVLTETSLIQKRAEKGIYRIRPGLSGLAQVSGRNFVSEEEKVAYDYAYLCKMSFSFDMHLTLKTVVYVLKGSDIYI